MNAEVDMYNFIPADKLERVNTKEYGDYFESKDSPFVFATCNGDPIFFINGKIYTHPHGTGKAKPSSYEKLANNFIGFLNYIIQEIDDFDDTPSTKQPTQTDDKKPDSIIDKIGRKIDDWF